jgi:hypothetical protein
VALCTLSAVNLGALESIDELEEITEIIVRALDSLLEGLGQKHREYYNDQHFAHRCALYLHALA